MRRQYLFEVIVHYLDGYGEYVRIRVMLIHKGKEKLTFISA